MIDLLNGHLGPSHLGSPAGEEHQETTLRVIQGLCEAAPGATWARIDAQAFDADLRAWQANATEQLRAIVPGAVVKTRMRVKGEYQTRRGEQGEVRLSIVIALTPEEGSLLQDEPHISGDADKIPPECVCVFCACEGRPDGSCVGETLCCCKFTVKPGATEGLDYYEWKRIRHERVRPARGCLRRRRAGRGGAVHDEVRCVRGVLCRRVHHRGRLPRDAGHQIQHVDYIYVFDRSV